MSHQNRIQSIGFKAEPGEPFFSLGTGESSVNQYTGIASFNQHGITLAATAERGKPHSDYLLQLVVQQVEYSHRRNRLLGITGFIEHHNTRIRAVVTQLDLVVLNLFLIARPECQLG